MSRPKRNQRKAKVSGVSSKDAIQRLEYFISKEFHSTIVPDKGQYVILHRRIHLEDKNYIDVIVYTTDTIYISASPFVPSNVFGEVATRIVRLAQQSITRLEEIRPLSLQRAKSILGFASTLNLDDEFQRMVIVILADTSDEIVLREQMKAARIEGAPLEEGIPIKIKKLKDKGLIVYKEDEMKNIREIRNRIVHYGDIPDKMQATEALKIARSVIELVSKQ